MWGVFIAAYICICGVSVFFISKRNTRYNIGINLLAQGLIITVLAQQLGAFIFSWVGMLMFFPGLVFAFFYVTQGKTSMYEESNSSNHDIDSSNESERESMTSLLWKMPFPVAVTDSKGVIIGANQRFYEAFGSEPGTIEGSVINDILPLDQEDITLTTGRWWISQAKEGSRYYFSLTPTYNCKPAESPAHGSMSVMHGGQPDVQLFDPMTKIYTDEYRKIRGPEEVARAQRYARQLSGILLEMAFEPSTDITVSDQQKDMLFNAFGVKVKTLLRAMDCAFLIDQHRIQILLPETSGGGAKTLLSRLITIPQTIFDEEIRNLLNPKVKAGMYFYNGASRMEYGIFSATLEEALIKAKESPSSEAA